MRNRLLPALLALAASAGCVDFVDPSGLRLAEDARITVDLGVSDAPAAVCSADADAGEPVRPAPGMATLCVDAKLDTGRDKYGALIPIENDTLYVLGVPLVPTLDEDSARVYRAAFRFPRDQIAETAYTVRFPRVRGVAVPDVQLGAVERVGSDTLRRAPGEGVRVEVQLPLVEPRPRASYQDWLMTMAGDSASALYNGRGTPRPAYEYPASVLATLGSERYRADLSWTQQVNQRLTDAADARIQVNVYLRQRILWRVLTVAPE